MKHIVIPALAVCLGTAALAPVSALTANAAENQAEPTPIVMQTENEVQPRAFTQLYINMRTSESKGYVEGYVTNTFTLFSTTVYVRLCLYSSYTHTTDISQMKLEAMVVAPDLDMGQELVAKVSTGGEKKYWCAYMQYTINNGATKSGQSETGCYDADGTLLYIEPQSFEIYE